MKTLCTPWENVWGVVSASKILQNMTWDGSLSPMCDLWPGSQNESLFSFYSRCNYVCLHMCHTHLEEIKSNFKCFDSLSELECLLIITTLVIYTWYLLNKQACAHIYTYAQQARQNLKLCMMDIFSNSKNTNNSKIESCRCTFYIYTSIQSFWGWYDFLNVFERRPWFIFGVLSWTRVKDWKRGEENVEQNLRRVRYSGTECNWTTWNSHNSVQVRAAIKKDRSSKDAPCIAGEKKRAVISSAGEEKKAYRLLWTVRTFTVCVWTTYKVTLLRQVWC